MRIGIRTETERIGTNQNTQDRDGAFNDFLDRILKNTTYLVEKINDLPSQSKRSTRISVGVALLAISLTFLIDFISSDLRILYAVIYGALGLFLLYWPMIHRRVPANSPPCNNQLTTKVYSTSIPSVSIGQWNTQNDAMKQLDQLNAMERQQDTNVWSSTAMFAAASGVLLVALVTAFGRIAREGELEIAFGILGLAVCAAWAITATRAITYYIIWIKGAVKLQQDYGIPKEYCVWKDIPPKGIPSSVAKFIIIGLFTAIWGYISVYGAYITEISWHAALVSSAILIAAFVFGYEIIFLKKLNGKEIKEV
ncbi:MAG: hypothetical protein E4H14_15155 [Candidatus Thorarchaeota archaeon]|nr:MAG: hypothetical protein E4H14_15155 [Candidatus Thorarchaeota archaeon]